MDFRKWQEEQLKNRKVEPKFEILFFARKEELAEMEKFLSDKKNRIFCLYGVPMIGKTTLVRQFLKNVKGFDIKSILFLNPENPEITLDKKLGEIDWGNDTPKLIVIENFEEALQWKGDKDHLHEIKYNVVRQFLEYVSKIPQIKVILESRFQIKLNFLPEIYTNLSNNQLGKLDRKELYKNLNSLYRHNSVSFETFEKVCEKFDDHIWLIEMAMQDKWHFQDVRESINHPKSITQKLWDKLQEILKKLPTSQRTILSAFSLINPLPESDLERELGKLSIFQRKDVLEDDLFSLRKKLLAIYNAQNNSYEINPFLREVCFTFLKEQKEMQSLKSLPFFDKSPKPKFDAIRQAQEKGDYGTFYKLLRELRKKGEYVKVHEILDYVFENDAIINKAGVLNEKGITFKWQENYDEAILILNKALKIEPDNVKVLNELGIIYKEQKNYPKAIKVLNRALLIEPNKRESLNELGIIYKEQKKYDDAIDVLEKVLKIDENDKKTLNELGIIYKEQKNYPKAIKILKRAAELGNIHSFNELGIIYKEQKNYDEAIAVLEKGLTIDPSNMFFKSTLRRIYQEKDSLRTQHIQHENNMEKSKRKILFVAANPKEQTRIQTDKEHRIIQSEMARGSHRDNFEFLQPQLAVTITEFLRAFNAKPHIIHFSGHGAEEGIIITKEENTSQLLDITILERLFKNLKGTTEVVVLNSCYSASQAEAISRFGMYVVGNTEPIGDDAAISFAKGLYVGLSEGKTFEDAMNDALIVVMTESPDYSHIIEVWKDGNKITV